MSQVIQAARSAGFTAACEVNRDALVFHPETLGFCKQNLCGEYNHNWSCPPHCKTPEHMAEQCSSWTAGVLVQTCGVVGFEDEAAVHTLRNTHNRRFYEFAERMKGLYGKVLPLGAGECRICRHCTCPTAPCRHPNRRVSAMEAYGLYVGELCEASGMDYAYLTNARELALVSCILFE